MSNPSINRWGLNLFWYRYWFNDKNNALTVNQDNVINKLIISYLHYGLLFKKNIFLNKYWYNISKINIKKYQYDFNLKYFRLMEYKNKMLNEYKSYKIRNKLKNVYYSKVWTLRFQNWFILNFYCFQPSSNKINKKLIKKKSFDFYLEKSSFSFKPFFYRYKFFLIYFLNKNFKNINYYKF